MKRSTESSRSNGRQVTGLEITVVPADRESPYWLMKLLDAVRESAVGLPPDRSFTVTINTINIKGDSHNG